MALLHHTDHVPALTAREGVRLNWRLLTALGGTILFWAVVIRVVAGLI